MPENLEDSMQAERFDETITALEEACSDLENTCMNIEEACEA